MLNNVVGGIRLDVLFRTIRDYGLDRDGIPALLPDPSSRTLLENALSCRRDLYNRSGSIDNITKTFRDMFANPLANLVWQVAVFKYWSNGDRETDDKETQIAALEEEVRRFF